MKIYFACGSREYLYLLLVCGVRNILNSFAYPDCCFSRRILLKHNIKLMIDSGAFTAWTKGKKINIDEYIQFIEKYKDVIDMERIVNLDVIVGGKEKATPEELNEAAKVGFENYYYMKKKGYEPIHVFHQGENYTWLERMLKECKYIGISPNNDYTDESKDRWLYECFYIIKKSNNPEIKTHAFGVTSIKLLEKYPYTSVDSSAWALTSAFGSILTPYGRVTISEEQKLKNDYIEYLPAHEKTKIIEYVESYGFSYDHCRKNYKYRNIINIFHFLNMEKKLTENPPVFSNHQKPLLDFLEFDKKRNKDYNNL